VAEGVETEEQLLRLSGMGCDIAQGYLFSHPVPLQEILAWLKTTHLKQEA
jgi:EAL domain-containing protein (putative c-di-GMP-specific phosphodiesterase class I)